MFVLGISPQLSNDYRIVFYKSLVFFGCLIRFLFFQRNIGFFAFFCWWGYFPDGQNWSRIVYLGRRHIVIKECGPILIFKSYK